MFINYLLYVFIGHILLIYPYENTKISNKYITVFYVNFFHDTIDRA